MKKTLVLLPLLCACFGLALGINSPKAVAAFADASAEEPAAKTIYHDDDENIDYEKVDVLVDYASLTDPLLFQEAVYSNDVFFRPSTQYSHFLAKQSIGLALSAFHLFEPDSGENAYWGEEAFGTLSSYFEERGYYDVRIDDYLKETSLYTVGTAIGHLDIEKDGEQATLVAVGIRGGNYKNEWQSNLTVDGDMRHRGFDEAATLVTDRIISYIGQTVLNHPVKIWVTGFSRAGAIANLVAANLNDSTLFNKEQIYAYTFAAPRAVWAGSRLGQIVDGYENIFNIVGASDFIPQFVPEEWTYAHYGIDKNLPGAEFDSTFATKYKKIQDSLKPLGIETYYNVELNMRVRMLFGMLLEIAYDEIAFTDYLQPVLLGVLQNKQANNLIRLLRETMLTWSKDHPELTPKIDAVVDFAIEILSPLLTGGSYVSGQQSSAKTPLFRLAHEHFPELYLYFLYSFKPAELFETAKDFSYVAFQGGTLIVKDKKANQEVLRLKDGQKTLSAYATENGLDLTAFEIKGKSMLVLPYDRDYEVSYALSSKETFQAEVLPYSRFFSSHLSSYEVNANADGVLLSVDAGNVTIHGAKKATTPTEFVRYLGVQSGPLPYRAYIFLLGLLPGALIVLLLWFFVALHSKIAKVKIRPLRLSLLSLFTVLTIEGEMAFWFFSDLLPIGLACKIAAGLCLLGLYLLGRPWSFYKRLDKTILPTLLLGNVGNVLLSVNFALGCGFLALALGYMAFYYLRKTRLRSHQWIVFGVLTAVALLILGTFLSPLNDGSIMALIAVAAALLVCFASMPSGGPKQAAGFASLMSMVILSLYLHAAFALLCSVLFVLFFGVTMVIHALYFDLPDPELVTPLVEQKEAEEA